ncbi:hypothetical protein H9I45_12250 [Polaribacter haliotis]|uniref:Uncharacterized protein n=1 Tax=Polaribacter haliotis TaxID=1888915 RepID=A0A7L8ADU9_9FLAO|nr:hypothetical protein [Polaribacter haliotis]QOD60107.1 hypothetical protein H9I45_12250 [Polaribacter haliotis]
MEDKIEETLNYYTFKSNEVLNSINSNSNLTVDEIIEKAAKLSELEYKITALEVVKEN